MPTCVNVYSWPNGDDSVAVKDRVFIEFHHMRYSQHIAGASDPAPGQRAETLPGVRIEAVLDDQQRDRSADHHTKRTQKHDKNTLAHEPVRVFITGGFCKQCAAARYPVFPVRINRHLVDNKYAISPAVSRKIYGRFRKGVRRALSAN